MLEAVVKTCLVEMSTPPPWKPKSCAFRQATCTWNVVISSLVPLNIRELPNAEA